MKTKMMFIAMLLALGGCDNDACRIKWTSPTGHTGSGEYIFSRSEVEEQVKFLNRHTLRGDSAFGFLGYEKGKPDEVYSYECR